MMRQILGSSLGLLLTVGLVACDSMDLTLEIIEADSGWLEVANANENAWKDALLIVEASESEGTTRPCGEERVQGWQPGETIRVPACGEKIRLTLTADGETARFSYFNGQLYRRIGRKEVPIRR